MSKELGSAPAQDTTQPAAGTQDSTQSTSTLLGEQPEGTTPPAVTPESEAKPAVETTKDAPKEEAKPSVPEKYELKLPDGSPLSASHLEKVAAYAKQRGFSNEDAQALLERENDAVSSFVQNQNETIKSKLDSWVEAVKADKEIGGEAFSKSTEAAKRAVERFATPEFKKILNETGLGNHPELVRVFTRVGKAMSDDAFVLPGAQGDGSQSIEDIFYPTSKSS